MKINSEHPETIVKIGDIYFRRGEYRRALRKFKDATKIKHNKEMGWAYFNMAQIYYMAN